MKTLRCLELSGRRWTVLSTTWIFILCAGVTAPASTATAQPVLFDFNSAPIHTSLPQSLTAGGITARLSATGQGFSIQDYFGNLFVPVGFSGLFLSPNSISASDLLIGFDHVLTDFSILYAPEEYGCDSSATMRVTAFMNGSYVGTNTKIAANPGTWPVDTLSCSFPQGFDSVVIHYDHHPISGCTDWGPIFAADDMVVTPSAVQFPIVTTIAATSVSTASATLNGVVDAHGSTTIALFEWGTTAAYGNITPSETVTVASSPKVISFSLTPLDPATTYHYRVTATNDGGTTNGTDFAFTTPYDLVVSCPVQHNWNMVSVPVTVSDYTKTALYPTALTDAFAYEGAYTPQPVLSNGVSYWIKFSGPQIVTMSGTSRAQDSVSVQPGWNMIGSISVPVATGSITSNPPGIIASNFYGYSQSYVFSDTIRVGMGYWVKVNTTGTLYLSSGGPVQAKNSQPASFSNELPPPPPGEQAVEFRSDIPQQFLLDQNYPNPFNPTTLISFALPMSAHVTVKVCDVLGQDVATLFEGECAAGYTSVQFDASELPSGIYFYGLNAVNTSDPGRSFMQVRKMVLLR